MILGNAASCYHKLVNVISRLMWSPFRRPIYKILNKKPVNFFIRLMLTLLVWPKVITISGFYCTYSKKYKISTPEKRNAPVIIASQRGWFDVITVIEGSQIGRNLIVKIPILIGASQPNRRTKLDQIQWVRLRNNSSVEI